jgi:hypothetical protein
MDEWMFEPDRTDAQRQCAHQPCGQPLPAARPRAKHRPTPYERRYCSTRCRVAALRSRRSASAGGGGVTMSGLAIGLHRYTRPAPVPSWMQAFQTRRSLPGRETPSTSCKLASRSRGFRPAISGLGRTACAATVSGFGWGENGLPWPAVRGARCRSSRLRSILSRARHSCRTAGRTIRNAATTNDDLRQRRLDGLISVIVGSELGRLLPLRGLIVGDGEVGE